MFARAVGQSQKGRRVCAVEQSVSQKKEFVRPVQNTKSILMTIINTKRGWRAHHAETKAGLADAELTNY